MPKGVNPDDILCSDSIFDNIDTVDEQLSLIPTPPESPKSAQQTTWPIADDCDFEGHLSADLLSVEYIDDFFTAEKLLSQTSTVEEYLDRIQRWLLDDLGGKDCMWSGLCADWKETRCRHRKVTEPVATDSTSTSLEPPVLGLTPPNEYPITDFLPVILPPEEPEEAERVIRAPYPTCDHPYHARPPPSLTPPSSVPSSPARDEDEGDSDSEIDVVSVTEPPLQCNRKQPTYISPSSSPKKEEKPTKQVHQTRNTRNKIRKSLTSFIKAKPSTQDPLRLTIKRVCAKTEVNKTVASPAKSRTNNAKYRVKGSRSVNAPGLTPEERQRRRDHNKMERTRRDMLKMAFSTLADLLPEQYKKDKCVKVKVLRNAARYNHMLKEEEMKLKTIKCSLMQRHEELLQELKRMQVHAHRSNVVRRMATRQRKN